MVKWKNLKSKDTNYPEFILLVEIIDKYYLELSKIVGKFPNCSEFACFVNACDNIIKDIKKDITLIKEITKRYFKKRKLNELVPEEWVQAIIDNNSSRKKGKCGEHKLISVLNKIGIKEVSDLEEFKKENYCVLKFSKKIRLKNIREYLDIKIKTKKQNKTLDLIIKAKNRIFVCETKHLNTSGEEQDKQISELIE